MESASLRAAPEAPSDVSGPRAGFSDGDRHGWIDALCGRLGRILAGRAAAAMLNGGPVPPGRSCLFVLPAWAWARPNVDVGAKSRARDGGTLLLPVRLHWSDGAVVLVPEHETLTVDWTAVGSGHSGRGRMTLTSGPALLDCDGFTGKPPATLTSPPIRARDVRRELQRLVADGRSAHWEALTSLEPYVTSAVHKALSAVSAEINREPNGYELVLDHLDVEMVRDRLLLGEADTPNVGPKEMPLPGSAVNRMLGRCLEPGTFRRVDPMRYIVTSLRQDAEAAIRRQIGDPHVGRKVRDLAREIQTDNIDALLAAYRERYPADRLASRRARVAMELANGMPGYPVPFRSNEWADDHTRRTA